MRFVWDVALVEGVRFLRAPGTRVLHSPAFSAPIMTQVPLMATVHDMIPFVFPEYRATAFIRAYLCLMHHAVRLGRIVLAPSEAAAGAVFRLLGIPEKRLRVTPLAVASSFKPSRVSAGVAEWIRRRFGEGAASLVDCRV